MRQRSFFGPDPLATVTFAGMALVACAALLGSAGVDGSSVGIVDAFVAAAPIGAVVAYLLWVNGDRGDDDALDRAAVSILTAQADDPTIRGDDEVSRAAADLIAAVDEAQREAARRRLVEALSR